VRGLSARLARRGGSKLSEAAARAEEARGRAELDRDALSHRATATASHLEQQVPAAARRSAARRALVVAAGGAGGAGLRVGLAAG